jgi:carbonic anhydrase
MTYTVRLLAISAVCLSAVVVSGCKSGVGKAHKADVMTARDQKAISPAAALDRLKAGNDRFVDGRSVKRNLVAQRTETASGQYPYAVVLSCLDSRSGPELVFDQGIGDIFVARVAGNYANTDIIGSMEFATKVAGAKLIVVMGHTECGAVKGAADDVELGNLTTVIKAIRPAVVNTPSTVDHADDRSSKNKKFVRAVTETNVRRTLDKIRADSPILRELEASGDLILVGAIHNLGTGRVEFLK